MPKPRYTIDRPVVTKRQRKYRRASYLFSLVLIFFFILVVVILYSIYHLKGDSSKIVIGKNVQQVIAGPQLYKSPYFEFSDTSPWVFSASNSTANKFVWISYVANLPVDFLTVYVNSAPIQGDLATTNVLPVTFKNDNSFTVGTLSPNCNTTYVPSDFKHIKTKPLSGTTMMCVPDSPQLSIMIGQVGSDYNLMLKRNNGEIARYIIIYHNLSITPSPDSFIRIMKTFQSV